MASILHYVLPVTLLDDRAKCNEAHLLFVRKEVYTISKVLVLYKSFVIRAFINLDQQPSFWLKN